MKLVNALLNFIQNIFRMLFDYLKLSLMKFKLICFSLYATYFTYNFFVEIVYNSTGKSEFHFKPQDVPTSNLIITGVIIFGFIAADIYEIISRRDLYFKLLTNNRVPTSIKNKIFEEMSKTK